MSEKLKSQADRAMEIFERMSPHQMAVALVEQRDIRDNLVAQLEDATKQIGETVSCLRDAKRYRWIKANSLFGMGQNGKNWDLMFDAPAPDSKDAVQRYIDDRVNGGAS